MNLNWSIMKRLLLDEGIASATKRSDHEATSGTASQLPIRVGLYAAAVAAVWTLIVGGMFAWDATQHHRYVLDVARAEARVAFEKDLLFRQWSTSKGGVYVPVSESTPPNPHLANVAERDITTPSGRQLTLMNPAYMLRQMHTFGQQQVGLKAHITSLKPLRAENAPDPWEERALQEFEQGSSEVSEVVTLEGAAHMRLMRPMIVEQGCLKCHAVQGYREGDVRGGISVSVPLAPLLAIERQNVAYSAASLSTLWMLGLLGIAFGTRRLQRQVVLRHRTEQDVRLARDSLDRTVHERTAKIKGINEQLQSEIVERQRVEDELRQNLDYAARSRRAMLSAMEDQKRAEEALQESERKLKEAQAMAHLGYWQWDVSTGEVQWSDEVFRIFQLDPKSFAPHIDAILALSPWPEEQHRDKELIRHAMETHEKGTFEQKFLRRDESVGYYHSTVQGKYDDEGNLIAIVGTVLDITERKEIERHQRLSAEILEILNTPGDLSDAIGRILDAIKQTTGFDAAGIRLRSGDDFPYYAQAGFSDDFLLTENVLAACGPTGGLCRDEDGNVKLECTCGMVLSGQADPTKPFMTPGGSFWTNDSLLLLDLPAGEDPRLHPRNRCIHEGFRSIALIPVRKNQEIVGLLQLNDRRTSCFTCEMIQFFEGISASIGVALERKQAEEEMAAQKAFLRLVIDRMPEFVCVKTRDGRFVLANEAMARAYGTTVQALEGMNDSDFSATPEQVAVFRHDDLEVITSRTTKFISEEAITFADGTLHWLSTTKAPLLQSDGTCDELLLIAIDITDRKHAEEAIREKVVELERWRAITLGREDRIGELKREINELLATHGQPVRYPSEAVLAKMELQSAR
jgi:PAS domain S-box-containing protein